MIRHCFVCHRGFEPNHRLEHFPHGNSVAYDPARGRLWAICQHCGRWSLAPLDARWEALDELERVVRDRGQLLARTDTVSLFRVPGARVLRVGAAGVREEAWWRYGPSFRRRRLRYGITAGVGAATVLAGAGVVALSVLDVLLLRALLSGRGRDLSTQVENLAAKGARTAANLDRRLRYGRIAWRGTVPCTSCGAVLRELPFQQRKGLLVDVGWNVTVPCAACGPTSPGYRLDPLQAQHVVRRVLAYENNASGTRRQIDFAVQALEQRTELITGDRYRWIGNATGYQLLALEMAASADAEHAALLLDAKELERRWRAEEAIAAIADRELTPDPH